MCSPWRGSSSSRMISGRSRLTTSENTEKRKPGNTSSVIAAPPTRSRRSSTSTFLPARARYAAHTRPLCPPPITITSVLATFSLWIEKRFLHYATGGTLAPVLDGDLDLELRAGARIRGAQMREGDVLLEQRGPPAARGVPRLFRAGVDRHAGAPRGGRQACGEADLGVQALERLPLDLDADELPLRPARRLGGERLTPHEALLLEIHRPAEIELIGAGGLAVDERLAR